VILVDKIIISDIIFCLFLYSIIVISVIIQNVQNWTRFFNIKKLLEDYRLTLEKEMNKTERKFGNQVKAQKPNGNTEVWVFSHDLSTEVLGDQSQKIVKRNIEKGVRYVEFYYDHERNRNYTASNINKFKRNLKVKFRDTVTFVPLKSSENSLDILPFLLGSISFHQDCSQDGCFEHEMKSFFLCGVEKKLNLFTLICLRV